MLARVHRLTGRLDDPFVALSRVAMLTIGCRLVVAFRARRASSPGGAGARCH